MKIKKLEFTILVMILMGSIIGTALAAGIKFAVVTWGIAFGLAGLITYIIHIIPENDET